MQLTKLNLITLVGLCALLSAFVFAPEAMAGTDTTFDSIYTNIKGWAQGSLGKVLTVAIFLYGIAAGIMQQSLGAAVIGVGGALVLYWGPSIMEGIMTATI